MLTVQEEDYQPEYGEGYPSNVHGEPTIEGYQYRVGLKRAFESLILEQFRSYILTVGYIVLVMAILKCLTDVLEMFAVKVTLEGHVFYKIYHLQTTYSALLSKFIWSNWSVWTERFTNNKIWHGNKQKFKRGIEEIIRSTQCSNLSQCLTEARQFV